MNNAENISTMDKLVFCHVIGIMDLSICAEKGNRARKSYNSCTRKASLILERGIKCFNNFYIPCERVGIAI